MRILLVGGTSEARSLAIGLLPYAEVLVSVISEQGAELVRDLPLELRIGRLEEAGWCDLLERERIGLIVDASHPYALIVSELLSKLAAERACPYLRYERPRLAAEAASDCSQIYRVENQRAAVVCLREILKAAGPDARVFLSTGSKDLPYYAAELGAEHIIARVLPTLESLEICYASGLKLAQIIAMQGPFSLEMNVAQLRQTGAAALLSKASGLAGGEKEKVAAAEALSLPLVLIERAKAERKVYSEMTELLTAVRECIEGRSA